MNVALNTNAYSDFLRGAHRGRGHHLRPNPQVGLCRKGTHLTDVQGVRDRLESETFHDLATDRGGQGTKALVRCW